MVRLLIRLLTTTLVIIVVSVSGASVAAADNHGENEPSTTDTALGAATCVVPGLGAATTIADAVTSADIPSCGGSALELGEKPTRRWLIYGHAPLEDKRSVSVTLPGFDDLKMDIARGGSFAVITEKGQNVEPLAAE